MHVLTQIVHDFTYHINRILKIFFAFKSFSLCIVETVIPCSTGFSLLAGPWWDSVMENNTKCDYTSKLPMYLYQIGKSNRNVHLAMHWIQIAWFVALCYMVFIHISLLSWFSIYIEFLFEITESARIPKSEIKKIGMVTIVKYMLNKNT